jgi:hypothetical protein
MKHVKARNRKAEAVLEWLEAEGGEVKALQDERPPHYPAGCTTIFSPGWEVDSTGGTANLCQPMERDLYDCYKTCYWPAQVPDYLNNNPDWHSGCASATQDWRKIDLIFP